jgi:adenine-specific DNA-methyltransferase
VKQNQQKRKPNQKSGGNLKNEDKTMIDSKIMETTKSILKDFGNTYFSDKGTLKRNKVIEDLDAYTPMLMKALLANQLIHDTYTESIVIDDNSVEIFKLNQFIEMFTYKEYWQDSYTKFENKIGLTAGGKFIDESADVVLDFPFKDTVLKAGMTKEDQKDTDEPFLHETIAKAEIDQLLEPKLFVNATKYDQENLDGAPVDTFDADNLIIKGNNLIALHSLRQRYSGKVKMIYLDPPYNTGNDSFEYNDKFNHSSWLVFMKNRLEIAFELLREDGVIVIQSDDNENHYLKVLCDEIFGADKFVTQISVEMSATQGMKVASAKNGNIVKNAEYLLLYSKTGKKNVMEHILYDPRMDYDTHYSKYLTEENKVKNVKDVFMEEYPDVNFTNLSAMYKTSEEFKEFIDNNQDRIFCYDKITGFDKNDFKLGVVTKVERNSRSYHIERKENNVKQLMFLGDSYGYANDFYSSYGFRKIRGDWWEGYYLDMGNVNKEGSVKLSNGKKPERLVKDLIISLTNENDTILDFFMGSATTQAVAMKMNRRFIGIEQMDYIKTVSVERLKKVIAGEQGGISKDVNWQGGGSFVYAELMEKNQGYLKDVQHVETTKQLEDVVNRMISGGADLDFRVDVEKVMQDPEYQAMALADKKQWMVKVIDKNQLYYAYSEMEDRDVQDLISESDIAFNKSFYGERDL